MTSAQLDHLTDVLHNLPATELDHAVWHLSTEEVLALRTESQALIYRLRKIVGLALVRGTEGIGR